MSNQMFSSFFDKLFKSDPSYCVDKLELLFWKRSYNILNKILSVSLVNNERINRLKSANGGYKVQYESCYGNCSGSAKFKHKKQNS